MNYFKLLQSRSRVFYFFLVLSGIVKSITNVCVLMLINEALRGRHSSVYDNYGYLIFISLIAVSFICTSLFQRYIVRLTNDITYGLELEIIQKVRNSSYNTFIALGTEKIYSAMGDTRVLGRVPEVLMTLINSIITVVCTLGYLFCVSPKAGILVLAIIVLLFAVYIYRDRSIEESLNVIRDLQDHYYGFLQELLDGFKQIRISPVRNTNLYQKFILANRTESKSLNIQTSRKYLVNELTGMYSWYLVLGVIIYILPPLFKSNIEQTTSFITSILLIMAPVSQLVMFLPVYNSFKIAMERINEIEQKLDGYEEKGASDAGPMENFGSICFKDITYAFSISGTEAFKLDVAEFQINRGEIIFIAGGNGSGKTTFINILTGLCSPHSGKIFVDGAEVSYEEYARFNKCMSVVYADHHLFKNNYDNYEANDGNPVFVDLKRMLHLDGLLKSTASGNGIDTKLSRGEQKRNALLLALLEDKPILVLDEWASEQDTYNRKCFYNKWLAALKNIGKTIIVISHDDDYFYAADRIVKFNYGKIVSPTEKSIQHL